VTAGLTSQVPVEVLQGLKSVGVPSRYVPCAVVSTGERGSTVDCNAVRTWYAAGIAPPVSIAFIKAGIDAETAIAWIRAGFLPVEAIRQIRSGLSLESARSQVAKIAFSKAFRRSGSGIYNMKNEFKTRVPEAVAVLDVPSRYKSGMFSAASTQASFLDGGYTEVMGYGFGSHSYSCIIGDKALLLVCHRIGVQARRAEKGAPPIPSAEELEALLSDQRLNHWNALVAQANGPGFFDTQRG
jgi:hypothetical protein